MPMNVRLALLLLSVVFSGEALPAQEPAIALVDIRIDPPQQSYQLHQGIALRPLGRPPQNLRVRVFNAPVKDLLKMRADSDQCVSFQTNILFGIGHPGRISLDGIDNESMLRRGPGGQRIPTRITLVFESLDGPETGSIRIKKAALRDYFAHAVEIELAPSADTEDRDRAIARKVVDSLRAGDAQIVAPVVAPTAASMPPKPPCYTVNPRNPNPAVDRGAEEAADSGVTLVATVAPTGCEESPEPPPEPGRSPAGF